MFWRILLLVFAGSAIPALIRWVLQLVYKISEDEEKLRSQLRSFKDELKGISAVDEFARYARLKRKMTAVEEELVKTVSGRHEVRDGIQTKLVRPCQVAIGAILVYSVITSRYEPVIEFPANWFWPLGWMFSFPLNASDVLGCSTWLIICNTVNRALLK